MSGSLLRGAALLVMLMFAVQGLSTTAKRLWAPSHFHLLASAPASAPATPAPADAAQVAGHGHGGAPVHDHGGPQADAEAAAWKRASAAGAASRFNHAPAFDFDFGGDDSRADRLASPAKHGPAQSGNAVHQHAAGSGHRHDPAQRGVVFVDTGANQQTPAAIAAGFDAYWSIVPPGRVQTLVRRPHAPPPPLTQVAQASRSDGPPDRPPRG